MLRVEAREVNISGGTLRWGWETTKRSWRKTTGGVALTVIATAPLLFLLLVAVLLAPESVLIRSAVASYWVFLVFVGIKAGSILMRYRIQIDPNQPPAAFSGFREPPENDDERLAQSLYLLGLLVGGYSLFALGIVVVAAGLAVFVGPIPIVVIPAAIVTINEFLDRHRDDSALKAAIRLVNWAYLEVSSPRARDRVRFNQIVSFAQELVSIMALRPPSHPKAA